MSDKTPSTDPVRSAALLATQTLTERLTDLRNLLNGLDDLPPYATARLLLDLTSVTGKLDKATRRLSP
jgi:hypothetical protein